MSTPKIIPFAPQSPEGQAALERYQRLYRAAGKTIEFGETVRLGGIVVGGVLVVAASVVGQLSLEAHAGFTGAALTLLGCALLAVLLTQLWDQRFQTRVRLLEGAIDFVVCSSPYLTEAERGELMFLRRRSGRRSKEPASRA